MDFKDYCSENKGFQNRLAKKMEVSVGYVSHMAVGRRAVPAKYCLLIENMTNGAVSRKDLRPYDYLQIWPELKEI